MGNKVKFNLKNVYAAKLTEKEEYQGKIAGSFVSADTYLVIPEGVYRSMNPSGTAYGYLWVDCDKKDVTSVEQSLNTLISSTSHIKMDTYHAQLQSAEVAARMMKLGCYLFMAVVEIGRASCRERV